MAEHFDLMVFGGGPGGYASAIAAAKGGLKVVLFEKERLGGTCLNVGCIPTKYLLDKASKVESIRTLTGNGLIKEAGCFSFKKVQSGKNEVVNKLVNNLSYLIKANNITVVQGEAQLKSGCKAVCNRMEYEADNVIIATGSLPISITFPGAEHAVDSTGVLSIEKLPQRMVVIGGGVIGLEIASAYASFGSEVTVIEMMDSLLPNEQAEAARLLTSVLKKRGLKILTGSKVERIEKNAAGLTVFYSKNGKRYEEASDMVLMAIGRKARLSGIDAKELGLKLTAKGFVEVDGHMKTNLDHVYAIGDAAGGYQLAHVAYAEGETAVANILGHNKEVDYNNVPRCVYSIPCFAAVGMTSDQAKSKGIETVMGSFSYEGNGMALAEGASGTVYAIMDKNSQETVGIQIVGENASELISFATLAVSKKLTLSEWEDLIVAHPSLSEMIREAAMDAFKKAIHKV